MLYIVGFWHLFDYTTAFPDWKNSFTHGLSLVVLGLFVVISGFLVGLSVKKSTSILDFYKTRFVRIYLLYAFAVILFFLYGLNSGTTSLKSLFFISMVVGPPPLTLWFINMLVLFYLVTPLLFKLTENPMRYFSFIISTSMLIFIFLGIINTLDKRVVLYFPCFCIGIYCSQHGLQDRNVSIRSALLLLSLWLTFSYIGIDAWGFNILMDIFLILSCSYLIFAISHYNENIFKKFQIVSFISFSSFAMYLFHRPIYLTLQTLYFPENEQLQVIYLLTACLPLMICISWGLQKLYDRGCIAVTKFL